MASRRAFSLLVLASSRQDAAKLLYSSSLGGLVAGDQLRRRAPAGLILEIDISDTTKAAPMSSIDQGGEKRRKSD
jgi:hypothetical protein